MPADNDLLFGKIAVEMKLCTSAEVAKCIEIQGRSTAPMPLGRHLVSEGFITEDGHSKILAVQRARMRRVDPATNRSKQDILFGKVAVKEGLLTEEQVNSCLRIQGQPGERRTLGEIMVAQKLLSARQVKELLGRQWKSIMHCGPCRLSFTVTSISKGKRINCPKCKGSLHDGKPTDSLRTDGEVQSESTARLRQAAVQAKDPGASSSVREVKGSCPFCGQVTIRRTSSDGRVDCLGCGVRYVPG